MPPAPTSRPETAPTPPTAWAPEAWTGFVVRIVRTDATGGLLLAVAVVAAMVWSNLPAHPAYQRVWDTALRWSALPPATFGTVRQWIDNGVMSIFFLAVGLEVGRERFCGSLRDNRNALLPVVAAIGGMAGAAVAYLIAATAAGGGPALRGWGVPMATDVAFALGALALLGRRVPAGLRVFVLALAVADDIGSVVVLAIVSTGHLRPWGIGGAIACLAGVALARRRITAAWVYLLATVPIWWLLAWGGVEPTLAGAFVGMLAPCASVRRMLPRTSSARWSWPARRSRAPGGPHVLEREGPSIRLARVVGPLSMLVALPLFALANTGVPLTRQLFDDAGARTVLSAVIVARLAGKTGGITAAVLVSVRLGLADLPAGVRRIQLTGAAAICGMGFTVPLLFASAAFSGTPLLLGGSKVGLLAGTVLGFLAGAALLVAAGSPCPPPAGPATGGTGRSPLSGTGS